MSRVYVMCQKVRIPNSSLSKIRFDSQIWNSFGDFGTYFKAMVNNILRFKLWSGDDEGTFLLLQTLRDFSPIVLRMIGVTITPTTSSTPNLRPPRDMVEHAIQAESFSERSVFKKADEEDCALYNHSGRLRPGFLNWDFQVSLDNELKPNEG